MNGSGDFMIGGSVWPGLSKAIEESGEFLQVAGKLMGSAGNTDHWSGDLIVGLKEEIADLYAALDFFVLANTTISQAQIMDRRSMKLARFNQWHHEAQKSAS